MPALYERTDRIWRLAYEQEGQVMHEAFDAEARVADPLSLGRGTSPRWASDGFRLLMLRGRSGGQLAAYDVVVRNLRTEKELVLADKGVLRGPVWSPDEQSAAFYVRDPGDNKPWRIQVASAVEERKVHDLGADVVVNENFESEGPSWEPGGRRIWFFSKQHRKEGYYPLVAADVASGKLAVVDYPSRCTTPFDLAINPVTEAPELVFVAHDGLPQDVFVLFLNHY
jgi:Tol biopolymer transport system component